MYFRLKGLLGVLIMISVSSVSFAASSDKNKGNDSLPQGKPFVQLQTSINALQAQINDLVGSVNSIEERMASLNGAVVTLQEDSTNMQSQIDNLMNDTKDNSAQIDTLLTQVAQNSYLIGEMEKQVASIETALQTKQNIIDGTCPEGTTVIGFDGNSELICSTSSENTGFKKISVTAMGTISADSIEGQTDFSITDNITVEAMCPMNTLLIGGSSSVSSTSAVVTWEGMTGTSDQPGQTWKVNALSPEIRELDVYVFSNAKCLSFE